jgi:hypothetical protein
MNVTLGGNVTRPGVVKRNSSNPKRRPVAGVGSSTTALPVRGGVSRENGGYPNKKEDRSGSREVSAGTSSRSADGNTQPRHPVQQAVLEMKKGKCTTVGQYIVGKV